MARTKRLSPDAEQVAVYLTPREQLILQTIRARRKDRDEERTSNSEVIIDALWFFLEEAEGVPRQKVEELLAQPRRRGEIKVKPFPKTGRP